MRVALELSWPAGESILSASAGMKQENYLWFEREFWGDITALAVAPEAGGGNSKAILAAMLGNYCGVGLKKNG